MLTESTIVEIGKLEEKTIIHLNITALFLWEEK